MTWGKTWTIEELEKLKSKGIVREHHAALPCEEREAGRPPRIPVLRAIKPKVECGAPEGVRIVLHQIAAHGLPEPVREYRFHETRKWRFDLAWVKQKIAVEIEGGIWTHGRHTRGAGFELDLTKYNEACILGWKVLRYSTGQIRHNKAIPDLKRVLCEA